MEYFELSVHCEYWFDSKPLIYILLPPFEKGREGYDISPCATVYLGITIASFT